jgi:hypothetical protein
MARLDIDLTSPQGIMEEIRYFHPDGTPFRDGVCYSDGMYMHACAENEKKFNTDGMPFEDYRKGLRGGFMLFPAEISQVPLISLSEQRLFELVVQANRKMLDRRSLWQRLRCGHAHVTLDFEVTDRHGKNSFFTGSYIDRESGEKFDATSTALRVCGLSSKELYEVVRILCSENRHKMALVYDLNKGKFFLYKNRAAQSAGCSCEKQLLDRTSFTKYEHACFSKNCKIVSNVDGVYHEIRDYVQSNEFRRIGFVPKMYCTEWNSDLRATLLFLRYGIWQDDEKIVAVNLNNEPDFEEAVTRLGKFFCREIDIHEAADGARHGNDDESVLAKLDVFENHNSMTKGLAAQIAKRIIGEMGKGE